MPLTSQDELLVEQRVANEAHSAGAAYLLWFFLGSLGGHRFYLGRIGSAITILILSVIGWLTAIFLVGYLFLGIVGIWWIIDAFLIPGMIRREKEEVRTRMQMELMRRS